MEFEGEKVLQQPSESKNIKHITQSRTTVLHIASGA